jgi:hypothetical protein
MIPVHLAGWAFGIIGVPGVALGVVYPAILLTLLRIFPHLGSAARDARGRLAPDDQNRPGTRLETSAHPV